MPMLKQWAELFKHPLDLAKTAAHNLIFDYPELYEDIQDLEN